MTITITATGRDQLEALHRDLLADGGDRHAGAGGPALEELKAEYPQVIFTGARYGEELAATVAGADVFADSVHEDMYAAIDSLVDKLDRQVLRHKEKMKSHRGNGHRESSVEATG